jgi:2-phosphoglycerate kinase
MMEYYLHAEVLRPCAEPNMRGETVRVIEVDKAMTTRERGASDEPPRLLLICGATGVGKSTIAVEAAQRLGFSRLLSSDAIREIMRAGKDESENPALFRSSFSRGEAGDAVVDWLDTCLAVEDGISATISRARREGIDLVLEGVHLVPENRWLREWCEAGGLAVGVVLYVDQENDHIGMLETREEHSWRRADRYVGAIQRLRAIQSGILERTKITNWVEIETTRTADVVARIEHLFDLQWNARNA